MKLNEKILNHIDPDFFRLVECQDKLVGFIFAIPDYLQKEHDGKVDTLIIKTVAKVPDRRYAGLGNYLVHKIHQKAAQKGFSSVIHALMHDNNTSRSISDKSAKTIRQYALYGKRLGL